MLHNANVGGGMLTRMLLAPLLCAIFLLAFQDASAQAQSCPANLDSADAIDDAQVQRVNRSVHFCSMSTLRMMIIWQEMEAVLDAGPIS